MGPQGGDEEQIPRFEGVLEGERGLAKVLFGAVLREPAPCVTQRDGRLPKGLPAGVRVDLQAVLLDGVQ